MSETWTIQRILKWCGDDFRKRGVDNPRLDAELLVAAALELPRVRLYVEFERPLVEDELQRIRALVARRRKLEPVAYILGRRDFFGRTFVTRPGVLIPRPDTETLVDAALSREGVPDDARVLDLCTGSGCVGLTLAAERPAWAVTISDVSDDALAVAGENREALELERVAIMRADLFEGVEGLFDLVTANPPYITTDEMAELSPDVRDHEPRLALEAGADGLDLVRRILADAPAHLTPGAGLVLEVGYTQARQVVAMAEKAGFAGARIHRDLGGHERVVELTLAG